MDRDAAFDVFLVSVDETGNPGGVDVVSPGLKHDLGEGLGRLPKYEQSALG